MDQNLKLSVIPLNAKRSLIFCLPLFLINFWKPASSNFLTVFRILSSLEVQSKLESLTSKAVRRSCTFPLALSIFWIRSLTGRFNFCDKVYRMRLDSCNSEGALVSFSNLTFLKVRAKEEVFKFRRTSISCSSCWETSS